MGCAQSRPESAFVPSADARARFAALAATPGTAWAAGHVAHARVLHVSALAAALGSSVLAKRAIAHMSGSSDYVKLDAFALFLDGLARGAPPRDRAHSLMVLFGARGGVLTKFALRGTLAAVLAEKGIVVPIREVDGCGTGACDLCAGQHVACARLPHPTLTPRHARSMVSQSFEDFGERGVELSLDVFEKYLRAHPLAFPQMFL